MRGLPPGLGFSRGLQGHLVRVDEEGCAIHLHVWQDLADDVAHAHILICLHHHMAHSASSILLRALLGRQVLVGEGQCLQERSSDDVSCWYKMSFEFARYQYSALFASR